MTANEIIDTLGGTVVTAKKCGTSKQNVSSWRKNGIPLPWMKYIKCAYPGIFRKKPSPEN